MTTTSRTSRPPARGTPAGAVGDPLAAALHTVAIRLLRQVRAVDRASGLSAPRLSVLSVLVFGGPRSLGALAAAEQVSAATMSRLVTALVRSGHVRRTPDPDDARAVVLTATAKGRRVLLAGRARRVQAVATVLEGLSAAERRSLDRATRALSRELAGVR
ncbi:MAG: MarR family transcriptional regulator [Gemmatimonadaceae bacterium]|jgi:DNA-binding MarR family transcriptional regulator|nr:MarR family transcriptional regulator [Gemmatimonadaceae bacterium]